MIIHPLRIMNGKVKQSTPSPLRGTPPVSEGESVTTENTATANCPSETGGRAKRRGWIVIVFVFVIVYFLPLRQAGRGAKRRGWIKHP